MNWKAWFTKKPDIPKLEPQPEPSPVPANGEILKYESNVPTEKLGNEQLHFVLRQIACFQPTTDIQRSLREEYGIKLSPVQIGLYKNSKNWKPYIEKLRTVWLQAIVEEPLANKRVRIQRIEKQYDKADRKDNVRDSLLAIERAREEVEPKNSNYQIQMNQLNFFSDEQIMEMIAKQKEKVKKVTHYEVPE